MHFSWNIWQDLKIQALLGVILILFLWPSGFAVAQERSTRVVGPADEDQRLALVIGNGDYTEGALRTPVNDMHAMAATLTDLGFDVMAVENATMREMLEAISEYQDRLANGGVGVFYYAGHGIAVEGENYLIPIDAVIEKELDVSNETVSVVDDVLRAVTRRERGVNIVILDACRNDPFSRSWQRSTVGSGLARQDAPNGTLIAYATQPGSTASDGDGDNGTYTAELVRQMAIPQPVALMFQRVREEVFAKTNGSQTPWEHSSLTGSFSFATQQGELASDSALSEAPDERAALQVVAGRYRLRIDELYRKQGRPAADRPATSVRRCQPGGRVCESGR